MVDLTRIQHFSPPTTTINIDSYAKIGISFDEDDSFFESKQPTQYPQVSFNIISKKDNQDIRSTITIGKTNIYELTLPIYIKTLSFEEIPNTLHVDIFEYTGEEEED